MVRDTSSDWVLIGETEPWFGVLSANRFLRANLTEQTIEEFYAQGESEVADTIAVLTAAFGFSRVKTALDFGSGLGRLVFAMRHHADFVHGVDISPGMVKEAMKQAAVRGVRDVSFAHRLPDGQSVDWINSYIVFQHIDPAQGCRILGDLLARLTIGGYLSVQLTFCHDHRHTTELARDVDSYVFDGAFMRVLEERAPVSGSMAMYDYDLNRVMRLCHKAGLRDVLTRHTDHGGCHGIWLFGKRTG